MANADNNKVVVSLLVVVIIGAVLYLVLTRPDDRSFSERFGDAVETLPEEGIDDAARQLERRTPGEKLGDGVKEIGDDIKRSTDNQ